MSSWRQDVGKQLLYLFSRALCSLKWGPRLLAIEAYVPGNQNDSFSNDTYFYLGLYIFFSIFFFPFVPNDFIFYAVPCCILSFRINLHATFCSWRGGTWLWLSFHCLRQSSKRKQKFFDFKRSFNGCGVVPWCRRGIWVTEAVADVWRIKIDWQFVSVDCKH